MTVRPSRGLGAEMCQCMPAAGIPVFLHFLFLLKIALPPPGGCSKAQHILRVRSPAKKRWHIIRAPALWPAGDLVLIVRRSCSEKERCAVSKVARWSCSLTGSGQRRSVVVLKKTPQDPEILRRMFRPSAVATDRLNFSANESARGFVPRVSQSLRHRRPERG